MRYLSRLELLGGLIVGAGAISACSLVYDLSDDQCEIHADCIALGGEFENRECVAGVCIPKANTGGNGGGPGGCTSGAECLENPELIGTHACVQGACVPLTTPECPQIVPIDPEALEDMLRDGGPPIVFGIFAEMETNPINSFTQNYDLAFREFNDKTLGGFGVAGMLRQPLIGVACRATTESEVTDAAMEHLVGTLKVPGIVTGLLSRQLQRAFDSTDPMNGPFFLSALEADSTLVALQDNGRVWHMLPGGEEIGIVYRPLLNRALDSLGVDGPARVALVTATDLAAAADIGATITTDDPEKPELGIQFNGKGITDNVADGNFISINLQSSFVDPDNNHAEVADRLLEFRPHVVIAASASEFYTKILPVLEQRWEDEVGADEPRPFYLLSPYHLTLSRIRTVLETFPSVRTRMVGVNAAAAENRTLYNSYIRRLREWYPQAPDNYENFYDAPYYLLYAARAVYGTVPELNGAALATGMGRLLDGVDHAVGPDDIVSAISDLTNTSRIRLTGTLGPPDFSPRGARSTPGTVWCVGADVTLVTDVLKYDRSTQELVYGNDAMGDPYSEFPCIPGF